MNCVKCDKEFFKKSHNQVFCSAECREKSWKKKESEKSKIKRRTELKDVPCEEGEYFIELLANEYFISNLGKIYSSAYRKFFKIRIDRYGYPVVSLKKIKSHPMNVHRLVALAFIPNPENKPQVNHINGIKTDNSVKNLEWNTVQENINHSISMGLKGTRKGYKFSYKIQQPLKRKPVFQYDLYGNLLNEFESQTEASLKLGINIVYISRSCRRECESTNGFVFRFKSDENQKIEISRKSMYSNGLIKK